jgi:integrase
VTKLNHRLAVSGLFTFAKSRAWVTGNPVTDAARPKPPKTRPGILRPGEVSRFFAALQDHAPALVPFWAVRFFAGIREQEALRMDWSMIDLTAKEIHLPDTVTKMRHPRTVKMEGNLADFLTPYARPDGVIAPKTAMKRRYHLAKVHRVLQGEDAEREAAGEEVRAFPVPMPANAARHSYATYHLLAFRHAGETALQMGHTKGPELLHQKYKGIATEAEALAFWKIKPAAAPENVVTMKAEKATASKQKANAKKNSAR